MSANWLNALRHTIPQHEITAPLAPLFEDDSITANEAWGHLIHYSVEYDNGYIDPALEPFLDARWSVLTATAGDFETSAQFAASALGLEEAA